MFCKDLKVVNLNITEDNYEYKALFRLCSEDLCMDVDMADLSEASTIAEIKNNFGLEDDDDEIREIITGKIMEASTLESRIKEGKEAVDGAVDKKLQKGIDALSTS